MFSVAFGLVSLFASTARAAGGGASQSVSVNVVQGETPRPSGTPTPLIDCLQTRGASNNPESSFLERAPMRVFLAAGCAEPHEVNIEIDIESTPVLFTHVDADAAGGFLTAAIDLPAAVLAGSHKVVGKTIEHTYSAAMSVVSSSSSGGSGGNRTTQVLGAVITRHLPHTGADIARSALVGLGLAGGGGLMIAVARRRRPVRSHSRRIRIKSP